jgi:hypothetical protein
MPKLEDALAEIETNRSECLALLGRMRAFHVPAEGEPFDPTFRLIATPMLYSAWERCFSLCHEVALRLMRDSVANPMELTSTTRAVWLMHSPFYQSMIDKLKNHAFGAADEKPKKGHFASLCEFLAELDTWSGKAIDQNIATEDLVMTISNVNPDVVAINARAIGLDQTAPFNALKLGKLHDLVGRRNGIGHGGVIEPPSNADFKELWAFTESLINEYSAAVSSWMQARFAP